MGAVLKGRDCDLGRDLAVKILLESHRDKPEMIRRFIEEAQIAGQLQHPGIVPIYELGAFGDRRPYFAMKLVKGHTLAEILTKRQSPSEGLPRLLAIFGCVPHPPILVSTNGPPVSSSWVYSRAKSPINLVNQSRLFFRLGFLRPAKWTTAGLQRVAATVRQDQAAGSLAVGTR